VWERGGGWGGRACGRARYHGGERAREQESKRAAAAAAAPAPAAALQPDTQTEQDGSADTGVPGLGVCQGDFSNHKQRGPIPRETDPYPAVDGQFNSFLFAARESSLLEISLSPLVWRAGLSLARSVCPHLIINCHNTPLLLTQQTDRVRNSE
jgi:hypothetical protein